MIVSRGSDDTLVVLTGAGRGFGKALAVELSKRSIPMLAICRTRPSNSTVDPSSLLVADCARPGDLERIKAAMVKARACSNVVLINNAGYYVKESFDTSVPADAIATIDSNVLAARNMTRIAHEVARLRMVINIVSSSALLHNVPRSNLQSKAFYAGSKRFLSHFADGLREALPPSTRIVNLYPRNINTWSAREEPDSLSPNHLACWVVDLVQNPPGWDLVECVVLPGR